MNSFNTQNEIPMNQPIDITNEVIYKLNHDGIHAYRICNPIFYENGIEYRALSRRSQLNKYKNYTTGQLVNHVSKELEEYCSTKDKSLTIFVHKVDICSDCILIRFVHKEKGEDGVKVSLNLRGGKDESI